MDLEAPGRRKNRVSIRRAPGNFAGDRGHAGTEVAPSEHDDVAGHLRTRPEQDIAVHDVDISVDRAGQSYLRLEHEKVARHVSVGSDDCIPAPHPEIAAGEKVSESRVQRVPASRIKRDLLGHC